MGSSTPSDPPSATPDTTPRVAELISALPSDAPQRLPKESTARQIPGDTDLSSPQPQLTPHDAHALDELPN